MSDIYLCKDCKHQYTDDGACDSCTGIFDVKNNRHEKPTRFERKDSPRICEVLGVEVGEEFTFPYPNRTYDRVYVKENGQIWERVDRTGNTHKLGGAAVCWLINNVESIRKYPLLTEKELAICRELNVNWISMDSPLRGNVSLWNAKPDKEEHSVNGVIYDGLFDAYIGTLSQRLFPSIHPGDCIEVPHG